MKKIIHNIMTSHRKIVYKNQIGTLHREISAITHENYIWNHTVEPRKKIIISNRIKVSTYVTVRLSHNTVRSKSVNNGKEVYILE